MKTGDKVILNPESIKNNRQLDIDALKNHGIENPENHPSISLSLNFYNQLLSHAESESIGVVFDIDSEGQLSEYVSIRFESGFECGSYSKDLEIK